MSLEWEWPSSWDPDYIRDLKKLLQDNLQEIMGRSPSSQLRGAVIVDDLNLGCRPPVVAVKQVLHASGTSTKMEVYFRYAGDASITLTGLEINLDTTSTPSTMDDTDPNHLVPFFCPFKMRMHTIQLEGSVVIELKQTLQRVSRRMRNVGGVGEAPDSPPLLPMHAMQHTGSGTSAQSRGGGGGSSSSMPSSSLADMLQRSPPRGTGVGILLSAGGRSQMRRPTSDVGSSTSGSGAGGTGRSSHAPRSSGSGPTFYEMGTGQVVCTGRKLRIQCCDDPLKGFGIESNFDRDIPHAQSIVETTLKVALQPVIDHLKTQGITINLPAAGGGSGSSGDGGSSRAGVGREGSPSGSSTTSSSTPVAKGERDHPTVGKV